MQLILRQILDAKYGMFTYSEDTRAFWFNSVSEDLAEFKLIGIVRSNSLLLSQICNVTDVVLFRFWGLPFTTVSFSIFTFLSLSTRS